MFVEKHGGLWTHADLTDFELFDEERQLLGVVREGDGLFSAAVYEKHPDPQWRLPVWRELRPSSLFSSSAEAIAHLQSFLPRQPSR